MKNVRLIQMTPLVLVLIMLVSEISAQSGWEQVYSGSDMFMRDMCFVPGSDGLWQTGWAIAAEGDVLKTTDGGDTWIELSQSLSIELAGISFADETTGMIATFDNQILKSTDGGLTWTGTYSGSVKFDKIAMEDANNAVAAGTQKLYTTDGGTTWTSASGGSYYWDLDYASNSTYYGVNLFGSLGESTDGGASWTDIESLGAMCMMVDFLDDTHGMFGGDLSTLKVTHDGGSSWTTNTLGGGQDAINCGGFFDPDTVYAAGSSGEVFKSTDGGDNWVTDTAWSSGTFMPRDLVVTRMNVIFATGRDGNSEGLIWRKIGAPPIGADFEASETVVCVGSSVDFTDQSIGPIDSWSWEFEGGTPATSTDQNPTVTYNSTGFFDVKLVVTVGVLADSLTISDYILVVDLPDKAGIPDGDDVVCTDQAYEYTIDGVEFGHDYEWELNPTNAGTLTWADTTAFLTVADDWTGDFTLRARAGNVCGDGDWSDNFEGTVYQSPDEFALEGGGGYCLGGDGAVITLNGSQTDVDYELYLDGVATGNIVAGTGSEITFEAVTDEGYYTATASNDNCSFLMLNQVQVWIDFPPLEPSTPTGPEVVCDEASSDYSSEGSDDADSYVWQLSPQEAGTITSDGLEATVTWDGEFAGLAYVSLYGVNDCGDGNNSFELEISVGAPNPEVMGESLVCDFSDEIYETAENEGSVYTWSVSGGEITDGQGTYMVTVSWLGVGSGTVSVEEETAGGCTGASEEFETAIDDCTAIGETSMIEALNLYPNPAGNNLNIEFNAQSYGENKISVISHLGQQVIEFDYNSTEGKQNYQLEISHLKSGLYILNIQNNEGIAVRQQFIKR